jgi:hypothetical protein
MREQVVADERNVLSEFDAYVAVLMDEGVARMRRTAMFSLQNSSILGTVSSTRGRSCYPSPHCEDVKMQERTRTRNIEYEINLMAALRV